MVMPFRKIRRVIFRPFQIDSTPLYSESLVSHGAARFGESFNRTVVSDCLSCLKHTGLTLMLEAVTLPTNWQDACVVQQAI